MNKKLMADITKAVIQEVKNRPLLWNFSHEDYMAVDQEWDEMATALNQNKYFLKDIWWRCRDIFSVELKKYNPPVVPGLPLMAYYHGVWPYFENMLFLEDSLRRPLYVEEKSKEEEEDMSIAFNNLYNGGHALETDKAAGSDDIDPIKEKVEVSSCKLNDVKKETKSNIYVTNNKNVSETKRDNSHSQERVQKKENTTWGGAEFDEDINFAKSIVTYLRRLKPVRKLVVRNEIQNIFLREILMECTCCGGQRWDI